MNINENKMPLVPIEESKHYSFSEENDTINLENNSNDLNSIQNFLISNASNNGSVKCDNKKNESLLKKDNVNFNLIKRKKGTIRKDPRSSNNIIIGNIRNNKKINMKRRFLMNYGDYNTNASELSDIKDFENDSYIHENSHMLLYDHKFREFPRRKIEQRSEKIRNFFVYSPDIIQKWIRVIFNIIITSLIVVLIYFIFISVREDINKKVAIQVQNVKEESISCKKQYNAHKCGTVNLPLLNEKCEEWLKCMKTDHNLYQDISFLSAQMLGQIINAFIVQFEWKSICVIAFIFLLIFIGSNYALSIGGSRQNGDYNSLNSNTTSIPPFPYYQFYPIMPPPLNYNNSTHADIPYMSIPSQNKIFQNNNYSRNPYYYQNNYSNLNEDNTMNHSVSRNKDFSEDYNSSKKDNKKSSKRLGFLKYLTRDIK
ncbi:nucleus export protein BRR6, putative [Plasmodium relictum]|uniref:Nucleus export protein BRR6, putative n=1 Tax=Plasmodium relictum TaxID=85471 RepID=A0A1J1HC32_PLARL|nr:nucleus export protein BRR6, putative [Plasmodium relictum]CRH02654.1 nucleus export protein BRR6, putative [Plasmodium relictum]